MKKETLEMLYKDFDKIETRQGLGGKQFKYIKGAPVIHRLNMSFRGRWTCEVKETIRDGDSVVVLVRLGIYDEEDGLYVYKDAFGSGTIERFTGGPRQGQPIDLGHAFKGAQTDAIKKAASMMGIGLHQLYDLDENGIPITVATEDVGPSIEETVEELLNEEKAAPAEEKEAASETKPFDEEPQKEVPAVPATDLAPSQETSEPTSLTDVQKKAIVKQSSAKGKTVEEVVEGALGTSKPLDELTYQEAILAIRFANALKVPK